MFSQGSQGNIKQYEATLFLDLSRSYTELSRHYFYIARTNPMQPSAFAMREKYVERRGKLFVKNTAEAERFVQEGGRGVSRVG